MISEINGIIIKELKNMRKDKDKKNKNGIRQGARLCFGLLPGALRP